MPAPFARDLCGYRSKDGKPNTCDATEALSVELGFALFEALGVDKSATKDEPTGGPFSQRVAADLASRVASRAGQVDVVPERKLNAFDQFAHVGALSGIRPDPSKEYRRAWSALVRFLERRITSPGRDVAKLVELLGRVTSAVDNETEARRIVLEQVGEESLLKLDVTVGRDKGPNRNPDLLVGLSLKWSLRTDRAQDCRSQGAKMAALRRGPMPHFAAVTMEPRPYMLNLLGGGSGDVDCVYHLDLPALTTAVTRACSGKGWQRARALDTFRRLVEQRRVRDYDELVGHILSL